MKRDYEAIVLGLGGIGCGVLYWLSRRLGPEVLGLEQFELGHDKGGSQDHSRIIRYTYHSPYYVRLAAGAYDAWSVVEEESGERLVVRCGGLDLFPEGGCESIRDYSGSLESAGVPFELLTASETRRRWPQFRIEDSTEGLYQADGGYVKAAEGNAAHQKLASQRGATLLAGVEVRGIAGRDGEYQIDTTRGTFCTGGLIIAAGAWTSTLLGHFGVRLPLRVTQEQVTYFHPTDPQDFEPGRFAIWIWNDEPCYYGFPLNPSDGAKVAQDLGGEEVTADNRSFEPNAENLSGVQRFCRQHLPALEQVNYTKTCLYTLTPDRDFLLDAVPGQNGAWFAVGAGHAFKFASHLGRILSELALDGVTPADIELFRADRVPQET
jgi:sarcosine oxidase